MKNFWSIFIVMFMLLLSFAAMQTPVHATSSDTEVQYDPYPDVIQNQVYMIVNKQHVPTIKLENMSSFHRHYQYFYNQKMCPELYEFRVDETDILMIRCDDKWYYAY